MAYYWKNKIKEHFIKRRYLEVLKDCSYLYAKIIAELDSEMVKQQSKLNEMKTIEMFSMLADMALEHEEEARALFEYYQVTKTKNNWQAEESIIEMIGNFDKNLCELSMVIQSIQDIDIDKMCEKIDNLIMEYADVEKQWEVLREEMVKNKISEEDIRRIREAYFEGFKKGNFAELNIVTMETIKNASTMLNIVNSILTLIKVLAV